MHRRAAAAENLYDGRGVDRDTGIRRKSNSHVLAVDSVAHALAEAAGVAPPPRHLAGGYIAPENRVENASKAAVVTEVRGGGSQEKGSGDGKGKLAHQASGHVSRITGVAMDALNSTILSCDSSGWVWWWDLESRRSLHTPLRLPSPPTSLNLHRGTGLAAFSCEDFSVRVIDITMPGGSGSVGEGSGNGAYFSFHSLSFRAVP